MIFYEISGKLRTLEACALFDKHGRVDRDNCGEIERVVTSLAQETMKHKTRIDVAEMRDNRFRFIVVTNFDALKECPIKETAERLLAELNLACDDIIIEETIEKTYKDLLYQAERSGFCEDDDKVKERFGLNYSERNFTSYERLLEKLNYGGRTKAPSDKKIKDYALKLSCEGLIEEVERLAKNKKYGTPVHYIIEVDKMDSAQAVYDFLLDNLKRNGRILRNVVNFWNNVWQSDDDCLNRSAMEKLYEKSEYGAVVIKSTFEEFQGGGAPSYFRTIKQIGEIAKANRKKVLTVLCVEKAGIRQKQAWLDSLDGLAFVEIKEKVMFLAEAKNYLTVIAEKDGLQEAEGLTSALKADTGYSRADLDAMYTNFYAAYQKSVEFPEYGDFAVVEKKAEETAVGAAYAQLQKMIGLKKVKEKIDDVISFAKEQKFAEEYGLKTAAVTRHMVFTGNPGTAKTTVARLFAQIMKDNELLAGGKFVEAGRADLIAKYVGQTAPLVRAKFKEAKGGVLFIDEAYSLVDDREGLFGDEAIATIVQEMENRREDVIVIFAGYKEEMKGFIDRNSGLKSRVAHYIDFPDYSAEELAEILDLMLSEQGLTLSEGRDKVLSIMEKAASQENFGNGRFARNLLDAARLKKAGRVAKIAKPTKEDIITLRAEDFELPEDFTEKKKIKIGFGA